MPTSPHNSKFNQEEMDALFKAVGFIVVQWGQAEQSLDLIVATLYQNLGGNRFEKRIPRMLEPKLAYLRKCLSQLPKLSALQNEGEMLVSKFEGFSSSRHDLIHGALGNLSLEEGVFRFHKLDIKNDIHVVREVLFDPEDFPKIADYLISLGKDAADFGHKLLRLA